MTQSVDLRKHLHGNDAPQALQPRGKGCDVRTVIAVGCLDFCEDG